MTRALRIAAPATQELAEAVRWYETQRQGLGAELLDAVTRTADLIQAHPELGASVTSDDRARRLPVRRFPYQLVYLLRDSEIVIIAVAHTKRRPGYWQGRS